MAHRRLFVFAESVDSLTLRNRVAGPVRFPFVIRRISVGSDQPANTTCNIALFRSSSPEMPAIAAVPTITPADINIIGPDSSRSFLRAVTGWVSLELDHESTPPHSYIRCQMSSDSAVGHQAVVVVEIEELEHE